MKIGKQDYKTIGQIATRAILIMPKRSRGDIEMDIECVHQTTPLRLDELLAADDFNFAHDLFGIAEHLNRETRKLENCFVPRFAKAEFDSIHPSWL
jgi:hypothetical protein